jgi:hypothetical protein
MALRDWSRFVSEARPFLLLHLKSRAVWLGWGSLPRSFRGRRDTRGTTYTNALRPVMARPVTSEFISRVPSYE